MMTACGVRPGEGSPVAEDLTGYESINHRFCLLEEQALGLGGAISSLADATKALEGRLRQVEESLVEWRRLEQLRASSHVTEWSLEHPTKPDP
jgi:hypothetical protein